MSCYQETILKIPISVNLRLLKKMLNKYLLPDSMTLATITHNSSLLNNRMFLISLKLERAHYILGCICYRIIFVIEHQIMNRVNSYEHQKQTGNSDSG